ASAARGAGVLCRRRAAARRRRACRGAARAARAAPMKRVRYRQFRRMLAIQRVLVKHGLDEIVWNTHLFRPLAWLGRLLSFGRRRKPLGVRLREALEELGPIFVKFGQALSVRPDLLPLPIAAELAKLQDQVPPFAGEQATA